MCSARCKTAGWCETVRWQDGETARGCGSATYEDATHGQSEGAMVHGQCECATSGQSEGVTRRWCEDTTHGQYETMRVQPTGGARVREHDPVRA